MSLNSKIKIFWSRVFLTFQVGFFFFLVIEGIGYTNYLILNFKKLSAGATNVPSCGCHLCNLINACSSI
jgi:hypothetical protein